MDAITEAEPFFNPHEVFEVTGVITTFLLTVIIIESLLKQPLTSTPVTVYVPEDVGLKETPLFTLPLHAYETPPPPNNATEEPSHKVAEGNALAVMIGLGETVMITWPLPVQPAASVPVTVYVPEVTGVKATPLVTPPLHTYDEPPLPVSVTEPPAHTVEGEAVPVITGNGATVIGIDVVPEQPLASVPVR